MTRSHWHDNWKLNTLLFIEELLNSKIPLQLIVSRGKRRNRKKRKILFETAINWFNHSMITSIPHRYQFYNKIWIQIYYAKHELLVQNANDFEFLFQITLVKSFTIRFWYEWCWLSSAIWLTFFRILFHGTLHASYRGILAYWLFIKTHFFLSVLFTFHSFIFCHSSL